MFQTLFLLLVFRRSKIVFVLLQDNPTTKLQILIVIATKGIQNNVVQIG